MIKECSGNFARGKISPVSLSAKVLTAKNLSVKNLTDEV